MRTALFLGVGVLIALAGVVFTLQGFGVLAGSFMSRVTLWAVIGPVIAVLGLIIAAVGLGRGTTSRRRAPLRGSLPRQGLVRAMDRPVRPVRHHSGWYRRKIFKTIGPNGLWCPGPGMHPDGP